MHLRLGLLHRSILTRPPLGVGEDIGDVIQDRAGLRREIPAELGQDDAAAAALEQRLAELVLESLDLARERWLRDMEPLGRAGEVLFFRDGDEVLQLREAHRRQ